MMSDAAEREKTFVEKEKCLMEHLNGVVKGISECLKEECQTWKQGCKLDGRRLRKAEHRIRMSVQSEMEKMQRSYGKRRIRPHDE